MKTTSTDLPLLLSTEQLAAVLDAPQHSAHDSTTNLLIVDVSSADNYAKGHIAGAVHLPPSALICGIKPAMGKIPDQQTLSALFSQLGLNADTHVIAYDDEGGGWAGRLIWTLDAIGHKNYSYLDGGILAWRAENRKTATTSSRPSSSNFSVSELDRSVIIDAEELLELLGDNDISIWDARSEEEYAGNKVFAQRGGHIPGAKNYDWLELMNQQAQLQLLPLDEIQNRLNALGISREKLLITHCQTHHRSGLSYLVAKLLGYPRIKAYHGSWSEWGNRDDTPIETGL